LVLDNAGARWCAAFPTRRTIEDPVTVNLNPYLTFDGDAREAMTFYERVLGGTLTVTTFGEFGIDDPAIADQAMHAALETASGLTLMAGDTPPGVEHDPGTNVAIILSGDDEAELRGYWEAISERAEISVPLETQMWGDDFGQCVDRFGIVWMVNISHPQA
jgi:PhnB protein